ncbi:MAG: hypothetical protein IJN34_07120 [Clostridia bacterium]|nr:hypothetical protein [Clostridia bacterium]
MKTHGKKILSVLLILALLINASVVCFADDAPKYQTVRCISNLCDKTRVDLLLHQDQLYISIEDAAEFSGYQWKDSQFERSGEKIKPITHTIEQKEWLELESGMEQLYTEVVQVGDALIFRGLETTFKECIKKTDAILTQYRVDLTQGFAGTVGYVGAVVFNIASQGKIFSRISGRHSEEQYKKIISRMVEGEEEVLSIVQEGYSLLDKLDTIGTIEGLDFSLNDGALKIISNGPSSDSAAVIHALNKTKDPLGTMFESIGGSKDFSLKGLDIVSQLELYQYFDSLIGCGQLYADMFSYTYGSSNFKKDEYIPKAARQPIEALTKYYNSTDYLKLLAGYLNEEGKTVFFSSADDLLETAVLKHFFSSSGAIIIPIAQYALRKSYDFLFDGVSHKADYIEESKRISELQAGIMKLYRKYKKDPASAINTKYAAMLYIRCAHIDYKLSVDGGMIEESSVINKYYNEAFNEIAAISDRDLTKKISNKKISADKLPKIDMEMEKTGLTRFLGKTVADVKRELGKNCVFYSDAGATFMSYESGERFGLDTQLLSPSNAAIIREVISFNETPLLGALRGNMTYGELVSLLGKETVGEKPEGYYDDMYARMEYNLTFNYNGHKVFYTWRDKDPESSPSSIASIVESNIEMNYTRDQADRQKLQKEQNGEFEVGSSITTKISDRITLTGRIEHVGLNYQYFLRLNEGISIKLVDDLYYETFGTLSEEEFKCKVLYFYDSAEEKYDFDKLNTNECVVTASLWDYRGGEDLFLSDPVIMMDGKEAPLK